MGRRKVPDDLPPMDFSMDEKAFRENFRLRFRSDLKKAGITQKELAARLGVGMSVVGRWAQGVGIPDLYNYWRISQVLKAVGD